MFSFGKRLPWSHCGNDFNTDGCLDPQWIYGNNLTSVEACGEEVIYDEKGVELKQVCLNGTLRNLSDFTPAVEEFWE